MHDVAALARVSIATVSAVVNQKTNVSDKLKQRVQEAIEALNYHPNQVARSLKVKRTSTIGMIVPDIANLFFAEILHGVDDQARRNDFSVILCNSGEDPVQEGRSLSALLSRRVDGILLASAAESLAQYRAFLRHTPLVCFDRQPGGCDVGQVVVDNVSAAHKATRHLIDLGHHRIAIITGPLTVSTGIERLEGFRKALQQAHIPVREEYVQEGDFSIEGGYKCGLVMIHQAEPPTAVFSSNNKTTLGLMKALTESHVDCPRQISVVGFDDFEWSDLLRPRLTTVIQPTYEIGKRATQMLLAAIAQQSADDTPGKKNVVVLHAELCVRESTMPPTESQKRTVLSHS
jgi:LacI family transcriptional regulator, galactose operon repressor